MSTQSLHVNKHAALTLSVCYDCVLQDRCQEKFGNTSNEALACANPSRLLSPQAREGVKQKLHAQLKSSI